MIAPGVAVDERRAAELAGAIDHHVVEHAPVVEVFDQGRDRRVEGRQMLFQALLDVVVVVPVAGVDGDAGAPRLDQPPRQQGALAVEVPAVAVAQLRVFLAEVEGLAHAVAGHHLQGLGLEAVEPFQDAARSTSRRSVSNSRSNSVRVCTPCRVSPLGSARFGTRKSAALGSAPTSKGL